MSEEENMELQPSQDKPDKELTFFLLDKLYAQLIDCNRAWNRNFAFLLLGSFGLITFAVGVISVSQFAIGGFSFVIGPALLLIGGAVMVGLFSIHYYNLSSYRGSLRTQVVGLCELLGIESQTSVGRHFLLAIPDMSTAMNFPIIKPRMFGKINLIPLLVGGVFAAFLPLLAEVAAFWKLIILYGWTWRDVLALLFIFGLTVAFMVFDALYYWLAYALPHFQSLRPKKDTAKVTLAEVKEGKH